MDSSGLKWLPLLAAIFVYAAWSGCSTTSSTVSSGDRSLPSGSATADAAASASERSDGGLTMYGSSAASAEANTNDAPDTGTAPDTTPHRETGLDDRGDGGTPEIEPGDAGRADAGPSTEKSDAP